MILKHSLLYLIMVLIFPLGCGVFEHYEQPTPEQIVQADYGPYPNDYQNLIKEYFKTNSFYCDPTVYGRPSFVDPDAAHYKFQKPFKGFFHRILGPGGGGQVVAYGYLVEVAMNPKSQYGNFVGFNTTNFFIKDNKVLVCGKGGNIFFCHNTAPCNKWNGLQR